MQTLEESREPRNHIYLQALLQSRSQKKEKEKNVKSFMECAICRQQEFTKWHAIINRNKLTQSKQSGKNYIVKSQQFQHENL